MNARLCLLLLVAVCFCAVEAAALPIEIPVGSPAYGEAWGSQLSPAVASDGDGYFVVWYDARAGLQCLVGTRISSSGEILDPLGIMVLRGTLASAQPKMVWSGTSYIVFWNEGTSPSRIMALRVSREGQAEGSPRVIAANGQLSNYGAVAANGSRTVVPYLQFTVGTPQIRAAILDSEANVLADLLVGGSELNRSLPTVAASRDQFLVVWELLTYWPPILEGVRFNSSGALLDAKPRPVGSGELPVIASDGRDFVILSYRPPGQWATQKIPADLEASFQQYDIGMYLNSAVPLWTGSQFNVYGMNTNQSAIVRFSVDATGKPSPVTTEEAKRTASSGFNAATNGRTVLKVWSDTLTDPGSFAVLGRISPLSGAPTSDPPRVLSLSVNGQRNVAIAYADNVAVAAWCEENGLYATRIAPDGRSVDGRGVQLASVCAAAGGPAVAFDGAQFVVAWRNGSQYAARTPVAVRFISPADGLLPETLQLDAATAGPALIRGGDGAFLAWADTNTANVAMISRATRAFVGTPIVAGRPAEVGEQIAQVDGAWNGGELLLVWREHQQIIFPPHFGPIVNRRIRGARVNANLTLLDTAPLLLGDVAGDGDSDPAVASDGGDWLLVWFFNTDLHARRITRNGTPQGSAEGVVIGQGFNQKVMWDGNRYLFAWKALPLSSPDGPTPREVRYAFLPRSGALALSESVTVAPTYNIDTIALGPNTAGRYAIAYTRIADELQYGSVQRGFVRLFPVPAKRRSAR